MRSTSSTARRARSISQAVAPWTSIDGGYSNYAAHDVPPGPAQTMFGAERGTGSAK